MSSLDIQNDLDTATNVYCGMLLDCRQASPRPYDPDVAMWAGAMAPGVGEAHISVGGAGWRTVDAQAACLGEAIERFQVKCLPQDDVIVSSYSDWSIDEPAVNPTKWVLFDESQYKTPDFPFVEITKDESCEWVCFRDALDGSAVWVPREFGYLQDCGKHSHRFSFSLSTGLSCGRYGDPLLLRGAQECIERDALIGAWWSVYTLEEWSADEVFGIIDRDIRHRVERPNLHYRFYRVRTPFSSHVTIVSIEGEDREGPIFSIGSACRENRALSWQKSILEAIQGRYYVRNLLSDFQKTGKKPFSVPTTFAEHALYYTLHLSDLAASPLARAITPDRSVSSDSVQDLPAIVEVLSPNHPVLFRHVTSPGVSATLKDWYVLRVLIPGLQHLHGDHRFPHLGGSLWKASSIDDWQSATPHPFP